jgi:hypothetical protein
MNENNIYGLHFMHIKNWSQITYALWIGAKIVNMMFPPHNYSLQRLWRIQHIKQIIEFNMKDVQYSWIIHMVFKLVKNVTRSMEG